MKLLTIIMLMWLITMMMKLLNFIISKKKYKNIEKSSMFECGYDPMSKNRLPFSLQFYLIGVLFLIFGVEISFILPFINNNMNYLYKPYLEFKFMNKFTVYYLLSDMLF